jgi:hypothetical protein
VEVDERRVDVVVGMDDVVLLIGGKPDELLAGAGPPAKGPMCRTAATTTNATTITAA